MDIPLNFAGTVPPWGLCFFIRLFSSFLAPILLQSGCPCVTMKKKIQEELMRSCTQLKDGWKFSAAAENFSTPLHKQAHYKGAKTENRLRGFASLSYNTDEGKCSELWSPVTVPHDYIVTQTPSPAFTGALGCQDYPEAWYRRNFKFTENDRGRRIVLCFEAVATRCEIYFNGCFICENHTAYTPFEADISDYVKFGETETNLLAVRICPTAEHEGWWYTGAGITRPVWLLKTDPAAIDHRGVWVRPVKVSDTLWRCEIETTLVNEKSEGETVTVQSEIDTKTVVSEAVLLPYEKTVVHQCIEVQSPDSGIRSIRTCTAAGLRYCAMARKLTKPKLPSASAPRSSARTDSI